MKISCLIKDPPNHRHLLAKDFILNTAYFHTILDVGGVSYKKKGHKWIKDTIAQTNAWGVAHFLNKKKGVPYFFSINVAYDYNHDRKPDLYYDGQHIPFEDNAYDIVTAIDVFEHIEEKMRLQVVSEMIRVAKQKIILVFPFYSLKNKELENEILYDMKKKNLKLKPSLIEHRKYELPKIDKITNFLVKNKLTYSISFGTNRRIMREFYFLQNSLNALLKDQTLSEIQISSLISEITTIGEKIFSVSNVEKRNAYRCIICISK